MGPKSAAGAGAADQRAVHMRNGKDLGGIARDRAAIEQKPCRRRPPKRARKRVAHPGHGPRRSWSFVGVRPVPMAPDGFIGDDGVRGRGAIGNRAGKLGGDDVKRHAGIALRLGLADADDGDKARVMGSLRQPSTSASVS